MKIHYTIDDSAARLPLAIRSADGVWDRAAELRTAPGVHLVELTTQHMLNTGATLVDEMARYFDDGAASEADPYGLAACFAHRQALEDLLRDLREIPDQLVALGEVEALFPASFQRDLHLTLAFTVVGYPAIGYVRTFTDTEGEEYHGIVVNLAHLRAHLHETLDEVPLSVLTSTIRDGCFNHEGFLVAYHAFTVETRRRPEWLADEMKDMLLSRGIAWYLGTAARGVVTSDGALESSHEVAELTAEWNTMLTTTRKRKATEDAVGEWLHGLQAPPAREAHIDRLGYHMARTIAGMRGAGGLREAIERGPDRFIALYNLLSGLHIQA